MSKQMLFGKEAREKLQAGVNKIADAVSITLGASGKNVMIGDAQAINYQIYPMPTQVTKDGVTVARFVNVDDPFENRGVMLLREASEKTMEQAGDGPQPLYSKVLTPSGFVNMGDLKEGDKICGTNGTTQSVVGVYPKGEKKIFIVKFSDGRKVECCAEHLWYVYDYNVTPVKAKTLTTLQLIEGIAHLKKRNRAGNRYFVPCSIVEFKERALTLHPYLLGVLLGDGSLSGTQRSDIEISIGKKKEHIISKIVLPDGIYLRTTYVDNKNYFRIKIKGVTADGKTIKDFLKELNLFGTTSHTKFIPKQYLYSSSQSRLALLQGLIDTDGHINKRGLFEYSTCNNKLYEDFLELVRGLGKQIHSTLRQNKIESGAYSATPIYRVTELKGDKYGIKITGIDETDSYTEMQCIKVSNADNLYITDNYISTHNTTTTIVLARAIVNKGIEMINAGANPMQLKKDIDIAVNHVVEKLKEVAIPMKGDLEKIRQIATVSANNDSEIGNLIAEAFEKIGEDGVIDIEEANGVLTQIKVEDGFKFDNGYIHELFVTNRAKHEAELINPYILLFDRPITKMAELMPIIKQTKEDSSRPLLIICADMDGEALAFLTTNFIQGNIKACVVKCPTFLDTKRDTMEDIAAVTNATYLTDQKGIGIENATLKHLGKAKKVIVSKDQTVIIEGSKNKKDYTDLIGNLKMDLTKAENETKKEPIEKRIARLQGGVAVIYVGAATETEMKEKKDRVDDAVRATKAAQSEGYVIGAGMVFFNLIKPFYRSINVDVDALPKLTHEEIIKIYDQSGVIMYKNSSEDVLRILSGVLNAPLEQIIENSGVEADGMLKELNGADDNLGYNAKTNKIENLLQAGIIDPVKVLRCSLQNAASVAGMILTSGCVIVRVL